MKCNKPKQIKARRMWADTEWRQRTICTFYTTNGNGSIPVPVSVIDISDPEALVEQATMAAINSPLNEWGDWSPSNQARAVLTALSILPAKKGRK